MAGRRRTSSTRSPSLANGLSDPALVGELQLIGTQLGRAQTAHASALRRLTEGGKGSVLLQVQSLADMGVPVKKPLPPNLLAGADAGAEPEEP